MARVTSARRLACEVGAACRERRAYAGDVLDAKLSEAVISPQDAAFARVLSLGVAATRGTLDDVLDRCMNSPDDVRANVRDALRVSAYEILFLRKDAYVAVDQGVGLVRSVEPRASRLANAVLRKVAIASKTFPFGNPATDDAALARKHGFPLWLVQALLAEANRASVERFLAASNMPPEVYIAANDIRTSVQRVQQTFKHEGFRMEQVPISALGAPGSVDGLIAGCLRVDDARAIASYPARRAFEAGEILVSDAAAQHIATLALPQQQPRDFLEVGSGRGTKSVLLQVAAHRKWGGQMRLTPVDTHAYKIDLLRKRLNVYGCQLDHAVVADGRDLGGALGARTFDAALVDAPCSGVGTLRRHPEIRWRLRPDDIGKLAAVQLALLEEAARHVRVGGQLTYATCTVLAAENELIIKRFLQSDSGREYRIMPYGKTSAGKPVLFFKSALQADGCDAHFAARLIRVGRAKER